VGIVYPTINGNNIEIGRQILTVEKLKINDSLQWTALSEMRECNSNVNKRVDVLTDDVKEIKQDVGELKEMMKEAITAIGKLGGKIDWQNIILKTNGETSAVQQREREEGLAR
jgi:peptidoglycan hydrolase CwlO-like protein